MSKKLLFVLILLLAACAPQAATPSAADIQTAIAQTQQAQPSPTTELALPQPTATEQSAELQETSIPPTQTVVSAGPFTGRVRAAFLNLRKGPSTLHEVAAAYEIGQELLAVARVPENDWIQVEIGEGDGKLTGWMSTEFLDIDGVPESLPIAQFSEILQLRGRIEIKDGGAVNAIGIAVISRSGQNDLRTDTYSNQQGEWVVYLPGNLLGTLDVQIVGEGCESVIMANGCERGNYFLLTGRTFVNIPQEGPILFQYVIGTKQITGVVKNDKGDPIAGVRVIAIRDDLAESYTTTGINGVFSLPAAEGIWEVYTVVYNPRAEGEHVTVTVTDQNPEGITLEMP